jgi:ABC-type branched-subunit amino acid transport system substrate-binding protein
VHEIEGIAAAQAKANAAGCVHPVVVEIGNMGRGEQAATQVAQQLKDDSSVAAVVGMGLSAPQSVAAADLLGRQPDPVPMVADVITAVGFDLTGSGGGRANDFTGCAALYPSGVGEGYFYRVAYDNSEQISSLVNYLGSARPDYILTPTDLSDPYTCTAHALVENHFNDKVATIKFDPTDPSTVPVAVQRICGTSHPVTMFYTARSSDLSLLIHDIDAAYANGDCEPGSITVLSPSDADRLLAAEPVQNDEEIRQEALSSNVFRQGTLKVIYSALTDVQADSTQYQQLSQQMGSGGFSPADLADGWAVNAYDAIGVVVQASVKLPADAPVTRGQVNTALSQLPAYTGAGGSISFDGNGDRIARLAPPVLRVCPPGKAGAAAFTVPATPGSC